MTIRFLRYALIGVLCGSVLAGCSSSTGVPSSTIPVPGNFTAQSRAATQGMAPATQGMAPMTAVSLALAHGVTGPPAKLAQRHATKHPPCPNVRSYVAFYCPNIRQCGMWEWTCTCSCVPTKYLGWPVAQSWNIWNYPAKCTACHALWGSSQTGSSNTNEIELANKNFKSVGQLTNGIDNVALGLTQDAKGNLYVGQWPTNQILVYAPGSEYPTQTLTEPNIAEVFSLASDKAGDLFVDGWANVSGAYVFELDELRAGSTTFKALPITAAFPGGLAVDKKQNLWVDDQGNGTSGTISEYPAPYSKPKTSFTYAGDDIEISIDSTNSELVASNNFLQGSSVYSGGVVYSIPSGQVLSSATPSLGYMYGICFQKPSKI